MTDGDVARIEAALEIVLPAAYRSLMVPFPVPAYVGNAETELWDDADRLISLNRELRDGAKFVQRWPNYMFAMGCDQGGSASAIDLRDLASPIWWAERCHLDAIGSGPTSQFFDDWAKQYVADLRSELEANGVDPDGSPAARKQAEDASAWAGCYFILVLLGVCMLIVLLVLGAFVWLRI